MLLAFPFLYVILDLAENGTVSALLARYPDRLAFGAAVLPYLTVIKRAASMLAIFGPVVMLAILRLRRFTDGDTICADQCPLNK